MNAIVFLLIVVVVCAIGGIVLWLQHRQPNTLESGLDVLPARDGRAGSARPTTPSPSSGAPSAPLGPDAPAADDEGR